MNLKLLAGRRRFVGWALILIAASAVYVFVIYPRSSTSLRSQILDRECLSVYCPMLHHLSFAVSDLARSAAFYDAALAPLGYVRVWADSSAVGYGLPGGGDKFAIKLNSGPVAAPGPGFHLAFAAPSREAVAGFHAAALRQGGRDNGIPELCPEYGEHYYAAFVIDPDGYRIEAVINHAPQGPA